MGAFLAVQKLQQNPNEAGSISVGLVWFGLVGFSFNASLEPRGGNLVAGVSTSLLNETGRVGPHDIFHDMSCCVKGRT